MDSNNSCWMDKAESILDKLLKFTAELAELENDPHVDADAISEACVKGLDDLRMILPPGLRSSNASGNEVIEKMRDLYARTQVCLEILERKNTQVAAELQSLTRTRQAVNAYGTPGRTRSR